MPLLQPCICICKDRCMQMCMVLYQFRNAKGCVSENVRWYALIRLHRDSSAKKQTEQLVFSSSAVLARDEWMVY